MSRTLCWNCQNAVPDLEGKRGCNWSRNSKPVEGWDAVRQIHATVAHSYVSYEVLKCPQFLAYEMKGDGSFACVVFVKDIKEEQTIDAVPVVRCKDCIPNGVKVILC